MSATPTAEIRLNLRLLPILVGVLLLLLLVWPFGGWRLLLAGLGGTWLVAYLWARSLAHSLRLVREMRFGWAQVGDTLEERFTLINHSWLPALWVEIVDHSTLPGYTASRGIGAGGNQENRWQTRGTCSRRGIFMLGPTTLRCGDPFGIYTVCLRNPASATLTVMPPVVPLPSIEVAPGSYAGDGHPRPAIYDRTVNTGGIREYRPGDSPRWIHWPSSAHHGSLMVRLFDGAPVSDWWIMLDLHADVQAGQGQSSTEEHGVILAASLADRGLRLGRSVGLIAYGKELAWLPAQPGDLQRLRILRALAQISAGRHPLADLIERARPALGRGPSLVIITPDTSGRWVTALLALLRGNAVPTVLLLEPSSFGGSGNMQATAALLAKQGIPHSIITRELLDRPEMRPGQQGTWKWRTLASGRVIPIQQPGDTGWRPLR